MKPRKFAESNLHLNVCEEHRKQGVGAIDVRHCSRPSEPEEIVECWQMSWRERLSALLFGRVWLWIMTGKSHVPPVALVCRRTTFAKSAV